MKYTVNLHSNLQAIKQIQVDTEAQAIETAKKWAQETKDTIFLVYISFLRESDGQCGYLNQDGYGISGRAWT